MRGDFPEDTEDYYEKAKKKFDGKWGSGKLKDYTFYQYAIHKNYYPKYK